MIVDPLADLKAEIAAEEAGTIAVVETVVEETVEDEVKEPNEKPEVKGDEPKPKPKKAKEPESESFRSRLNEEAVKRRQAERERDELKTRIEALENPKKPEEQPKPKVLTEADIRAQERASARLELQLEDFVASGARDYTQEGFDAACNKINELIGGPSNLIAIAIEATGSPSLAAKAIYQLGQDDATDIEKFLAMSSIRQGAALAKLATARTRKEDDEKPKKKAKIEEDEDDPPAPLRPIKGNNRVAEGMGDEVPDDVWTDRFNNLMNQKAARH